MKKIYAILAVVAVAACTAFAVSSYSSRDPFFESNVEALMRSEGWFNRGHHAEQCGAADIKFDMPYACTQMVIVCDWKNDNGCERSECPIHG